MGALFALNIHAIERATHAGDWKKTDIKIGCEINRREKILNGIFS